MKFYNGALKTRVSVCVRVIENISYSFKSVFPSLLWIHTTAERVRVKSWIKFYFVHGKIYVTLVMLFDYFSLLRCV